MRRFKKLPIGELSPYTLPDTPRGAVGPPIIWGEMFGNDRPVEVEIGFGKGLFLLTSAVAHPDRNFFGVEIVRKWQLFTATRMAQNNLTNVRVACGDGKAILRDRVAPQSIDVVHVYFPDPWWKARHRKRRVFTPEFAHTIGKVLKPNGQLSIATDVELYFGVMTQIVRELGDAFVELPAPAASEGHDDRDYLTNFERKFRKEGRPIFRVLYQRSHGPLPETIGTDPGLAGPFEEFQSASAS